MTLDDETKTPNAAVSAALKELMLESRTGRVTSFIILTRFSDHYSATIPEMWGKTQAITSVFGETNDLVALMEKATSRLCETLDSKDRRIVAQRLLGAIASLI